MLIRVLLLCSLILTAAPFHTPAYADDAPAVKTDKEKISYSIGMDIGSNLKRQELDLDPATVAAGLEDALSGGKTQLTSEQVREVLTKFQEELRAKSEARTAKLTEKNKTEGNAFLAENKKKKGVVTLPSGLHYKILTESNKP